MKLQPGHTPSPSDISPLISIRCAKGSKHGGESLAGEVRAGAPLKRTARDLKPDADDDICGKLHVLYRHSSLGNASASDLRFSRIRPIAAGASGLRRFGPKAEPREAR